MSEDARDTKQRSLGEVIAELCAGQPCPWCGEDLREAESAECAGMAEASGDGDGLSGPVLCCPGCGLGVSAPGKHIEGRRQRHLGAAA